MRSKVKTGLCFNKCLVSNGFYYHRCLFGRCLKVSFRYYFMTTTNSAFFCKYILYIYVLLHILAEFFKMWKTREKIGKKFFRGGCYKIVSVTDFRRNELQRPVKWHNYNHCSKLSLLKHINWSDSLRNKSVWHQKFVKTLFEIHFSSRWFYPTALCPQNFWKRSRFCFFFYLLLPLLFFGGVLKNPKWRSQQQPSHFVKCCQSFWFVYVGGRSIFHVPRADSLQIYVFMGCFPKRGKQSWGKCDPILILQKMIREIHWAVLIQKIAMKNLLMCLNICLFQ